MFTRYSVLASAAALTVGLSAAPASAATILPIISGGGETWVGGAPIGGGSGSAVVVDPHPAWQAPGTAQWISYGDTGYGGTLFAPYAGTTALATFSEEFHADAGSVLNLRIWADDTTRVRINGIEVVSPNFSQGTCAAGPPGCEPQEFAEILNFVFLTGGLQTVEFDLFQVGTGTNTTENPLGLLYQGTLTSVPEPASLLLLGLGFVALGRRLRAR